MARSFYVLDGHYQIYRAFYGLPQSLTSPSGEPTGATHVFCAMLFALLRGRRPDYVAVAMDVSDETVFRRDLDRAYKAHRDPAPEALHVQADRIVTIVETLGVPVFRQPGFEADDLMATIAERLKGEDIDIYLVSRDKDLEQLITDRVRLLDTKNDRILDAAALQAEKGYSPEQVVDVQTLVGDSTDNVPGVLGIGIKTAVKLIGRFGTAEGVLEHAEELTPKMCERVKAFAPQMPVTRQLVTLRRDVPFEFDLGCCRTDRLDFAALRPIFDELGFTRLTEALTEFASAAPAAPCAARSESAGTMPAPLTGSARYTLVDSLQRLEAFVAELGQQRCFAFDTETTGLNPVTAQIVGASFCWQAGEAWYLPLRAAMGKVLERERVVEALRPIFEDGSVAKVGHHLKYDMLVFRQIGIETAGVAFDTMIASFLLDPLRRSHSLDALVKGLIGHDMIPITALIGKGRDQITIDQVDTQRVCEYAAEDADFTWRLYGLLSPQMAGSHVETLFRETEMPLVEVLAEMEHNGITLDTTLLAKLSAAMSRRLEELTRQVHAAAGHPLNIDSTRQLAEVLFDEQRLPMVRKTKTGRSTDADTLKTLAQQTNNPIPKLILEYRELAKLKSTYADTLPKMVSPRTGRVHASFHQTGAVTGRLSSSDPNLQNIPVRTELGREIRAAVTASRPGHVLLTADYSQIELRLLGHFCQDAALLDAFRTGQDIHRAVAAQVNGVALEQVSSAQRSAAKAVNFGIIYGQSAFGLARSLDIPVAGARAFIDTYFLRYPGIRLFVDRCIEEARKKGYAQTILGRRRPVPELHSRNRQQVSFGERIAVNTVVQGSAADLIKRAMVDIHHELRGGRHSATMLIQVHDELVFDVPESDVEAEAEMVRARMESAMALSVPIVVDVCWGRTWADGK